MTGLCEACGKEFVNDQDWDDRHSGVEGQEYHSQCCPFCEEVRQEEQES